MVKIKNISSALVTIALRDIKLHREIRAGMTMPFKDEEYEYLTFDPGFNALIEGHYIKVIGAPTIDGEATVEEQKNVFEASEIKDMLEKRDVTKFAKFIKTASQAERDTVLKYAVELGITDSGFAALIKSNMGIDIVEAISNYRQAMGK